MFSRTSGLRLCLPRFLSGRQRPPAEHPIHSLIRVILEGAIKDGSSLVCIGRALDSPQDPPCGNVGEPGGPEFVLDIRDPAFRREMEEFDALRAASSFPRWYNGAECMPIRYLVSGRFYDAMPIELSFYGPLLDALPEVLLAIDATRADPKPQRYIELLPAAGQRRFAEVELVFERDNNLHIKILGLRLEPASAKASDDPIGGHLVPPPRGFVVPEGA